jgi:hypothetical protein
VAQDEDQRIISEDHQRDGRQEDEMDERTRKDALLEALETILRESRRLRGELHEGPLESGRGEGEMPGKPGRGALSTTA